MKHIVGILVCLVLASCGFSKTDTSKSIVMSNEVSANTWIAYSDKIYTISFKDSQSILTSKSFGSWSANTKVYDLSLNSDTTAVGFDGLVNSNWVFSIENDKLNLCIDLKCFSFDRII